MKTYTLDQVQDELIGKRGSIERKRFENEFQKEIDKRDLNQKDTEDSPF